MGKKKKNRTFLSNFTKEVVNNKYAFASLGILAFAIILTVSGVVFHDSKTLTASEDTYVQDVTRNALELHENNNSEKAEAELEGKIASESDPEVRRALRGNLALIYMENSDISRAIEVYEISRADDGVMTHGFATAMAEAYHLVGENVQAAQLYSLAYDLYSSEETVDEEHLQFLRQSSFNAQLKASQGE